MTGDSKLLSPNGQKCQEFDENRKLGQLKPNFIGCLAVTVDDLIENFSNLNRMVGVLYWGRSGSYLLCSLLQGHPHTMQLPMISWSSYYPAIKKIISSIQYKSLSEIANEILNEFPFLTKSWNRKNHKKFSVIGSDQQEVMGAETAKLLFSLEQILSKLKGKINEWTSADILRLLHIAYADAIGKLPSTVNPIMVFSIHSLDVKVIADLQSKFSRFYLITTVRNPVATMDSHLKHHIFEEPSLAPLSSAVEIFAQHFSRGKDLDSLSFENWRAVRFEDMHLNTEETMRKIADWIEVPWDPILLLSTADHQIWWFSNGAKYFTGVNPKLSKTSKALFINRVDKWRFYCLLHRNYVQWGYPHRYPKIMWLLFFFIFWIPPSILWSQFVSHLTEDLRKNPLKLALRVSIKNFVKFFVAWRRFTYLSLHKWKWRNKDLIVPLL